jgi:phosphate transport system protein
VDDRARLTRTAFHRRLEALTVGLAHVCGLAGSAMNAATRAVLDADLRCAEAVIGDHSRVLQARRECESAAHLLLALQAPVAGDLRVIVGALKGVADGERMGTQALHIAQIARMRHPARVVPDQVIDCITEMSCAAEHLSATVLDAVLRRDPGQVAAIRHADIAMRRLHEQLSATLCDTRWRHGVVYAIDTALLGRYYERFADHAVAIGCRVAFEVTGSVQPAGDGAA